MANQNDDSMEMLKNHDFVAGNLYAFYHNFWQSLIIQKIIVYLQVERTLNL